MLHIYAAKVHAMLRVHTTKVHAMLQNTNKLPQCCTPVNCGSDSPV